MLAPSQFLCSVSKFHLKALVAERFPKWFQKRLVTSPWVCQEGYDAQANQFGSETSCKRRFLWFLCLGMLQSCKAAKVWLCKRHWHESDGEARRVPGLGTRCGEQRDEGERPFFPKFFAKLFCKVFLDFLFEKKMKRFLCFLFRLCPWLAGRLFSVPVEALDFDANNMVSFAESQTQRLTRNYTNDVGILFDCQRNLCFLRVFFCFYLFFCFPLRGSFCGPTSTPSAFRGGLVVRFESSETLRLEAWHRHPWQTRMEAVPCVPSLKKSRREKKDLQWFPFQKEQLLF